MASVSGFVGLYLNLINYFTDETMTYKIGDLIQCKPEYLNQFFTINEAWIAKVTGINNDGTLRIKGIDDEKRGENINPSKWKKANINYQINRRVSGGEYYHY